MCVCVNVRLRRCSRLFFRVQLNFCHLSCCFFFSAGECVCVSQCSPKKETRQQESMSMKRAVEKKANGIDTDYIGIINVFVCVSSAQWLNCLRCARTSGWTVLENRLQSRYFSSLLFSHCALVLCIRPISLFRLYVCVYLCYFFSPLCAQRICSRVFFCILV